MYSSQCRDKRSEQGGISTYANVLLLVLVLLDHVYCLLNLAQDQIAVTVICLEVN